MTPSDFLTQTLVPGLSWLTTVIGNKPGAGPWQNDARGRLVLCAVSGYCLWRLSHKSGITLQTVWARFRPAA